METGQQVRRGGQVLALLVGGLLLLSSCSDSNDQDATSTGTQITHTVSVHGMGIVKVVPDVLDIVFAAEGNAATAKVALDQVGSASDAIVRLAKSNKVDSKDLQSSQIYLMPTYDYVDGTSKISGYTASITITVTLRDTDRASGLLDAAANAAGNALRLRGMTWKVDDPSKALEDARVAAMGDAKARATTLAKSGGIGLGKVLTINESSQSVAPPVWDNSGGKDESASPGIAVEAGTETITVNVDVVFELD
ncbi:unannotated protein [freshwater metagenome]|uniref:Unannotated protein n=1 Tax=freshwater metagenome TaxID=449393 RepID=A0A6J6TBI9_9ZZZZ